MSKYFNDAMLTSMADHAYIVREYNIVGSETNQVNRRECKFTFVNTSLKSRIAYVNMLKANALNVANQNVGIDLGKHPELLKNGNPFAEYMKEKRKGVYEEYKLANKWVDGVRRPQADCPMYKQAERDTIKYLPVGNAAYGKLMEVLKTVPAHLYSDREYVWNEQQERWDYENHMTDYAVSNMVEVKYSANVKDAGMFSMADVRDAYTEVTSRDVWDGKQTAEFSLFQYTLMVARKIKELSDELVEKGENKLDVNAELKKFFVMCVMKKFNCSEDEAVSMAAKAAFDYCFTVDAKVYEETGFEMRAEKLFNLFVEDWAELQIKLGEETLNSDIEELPEVDDEEEADDDDEDLA